MNHTTTYSRAVVRRPGSSLVHGLTTAAFGPPDLERARRQHGGYIDALKNLGLTVSLLPPVESLPDSVFVEDTAVAAGECVVLCAPGAPSRRGEVAAIESELVPHFAESETIRPPATLEGGDVMLAGRKFFVGISARTNRAGFERFSDIVNRFGFTAEAVELRQFLHLKTGVACIGEQTLVVAGELVDRDAWRGFEQIVVPEGEAYAANCIRINERVLVPEGFPRTCHAIETAGFETEAVAVSEFRKLDGGLSCLSIRF